MADLARVSEATLICLPDFDENDTWLAINQMFDRMDFTNRFLRGEIDIEDWIWQLEMQEIDAFELVDYWDLIDEIQV